MSGTSSAIEPLTLKVSEAAGKDVGHGIARMDPSDMSRLGVDVGELVEIKGSKATVCKLLPTFKEHRGKKHLQIDGIARQNAGVGLGESALVRRIVVEPATEVVLDPQGDAPSARDLEYIGSLLDGSRTPGWRPLGAWTSAFAARGCCSR
jgi:transitional endoplasmic reticulum ATPase